jgi:peptide/nickel transport system substrate-binding protein
MYTAEDARFDYLLWDRPFLFDHQLEWMLNPAVAESYRESPDHMQAILTLKPGLKWHDGRPYTAEDIAFSWIRIMDDRVVCRKARHGADQLRDCVAVDPVTVRFVFQRPLPTNKWHVNFPVVPRHVYAERLEEDPTLERSDYHVSQNRRPVGNGPYRFVEWAGGQRIVLERWGDYPGPSPHFQRILFKVIPDNNAALLAFEAGQVHEMELAPQQFALETSAQRFADIGVKAMGQQWTNYYIGWNTDGSNPFFHDRRVRRAMCHALNLPLIIDRVFFGIFPRSRGLFHPDSWAYPPDMPVYQFDPPEAARLLEEAGWLVDESDGWRYKRIEEPSGPDRRVRFSFTMNLILGSQTSPKMAEILQADLKKLGVQMSTQVLEWSVFNERNFKHEFHSYLSAWTPGPEPDDAWNLFHSESCRTGRNYVGYVNPVVDRLFEQARRSFSFDTRQACYRRIARAIYEDAPYTFIVNAPMLWAFDRRLRGVTYSPRGPLHFYPGVLSWWRPRPAGG